MGVWMLEADRYRKQMENSSNLQAGLDLGVQVKK